MAFPLVTFSRVIVMDCSVGFGKVSISIPWALKGISEENNVQGYPLNYKNETVTKYNPDGSIFEIVENKDKIGFEVLRKFLIAFRNHCRLLDGSIGLGNLCHPNPVTRTCLFL